MKRIVVLLLAIGMCLCGCQKANTDRAFDYEKSCWGDSKKQVMKTEDGKPEEYDDPKRVVYLKEKFGLDCSVIYSFNDEYKLCSVWDSFNSNLSVNDFQDVDLQLIKKYGEPDSKKENSEFYISRWSDERTEITHMLHLGEYPNHIVSYGSFEFSDDWKAK